MPCHGVGMVRNRSPCPSLGPVSREPPELPSMPRVSRGPSYSRNCRESVRLPCRCQASERASPILSSVQPRSFPQKIRTEAGLETACIGSRRFAARRGVTVQYSSAPRTESQYECRPLQDPELEQ
ncbi:hypothetical protein PYCCODRAFT_691220 [Trametes coccinea BRFM310]|uniref:Uncharacterized protein n=1 Tax=Trametes coccinea (strain BRFM310) TaxID=1353009 RepID=A0A1Y2IH81_TRAC3|nr:hypothetical protein PYCCODRAFT_691220 [Trametes coccinea BRFM310]